MSLLVVDVRDSWLGVEYVGRGRGSKLGNPFVIGRDGSREEVIKLYRLWLWERVKERGEVFDELVRLCELVREGKDVKLGCWCGAGSCHGDVIVGCVEWMIREGVDL